jgi:hypothetical protein
LCIVIFILLTFPCTTRRCTFCWETFIWIDLLMTYYAYDLLWNMISCSKKLTQFNAIVDLDRLIYAYVIVLILGFLQQDLAGKLKPQPLSLFKFIVYLYYLINVANLLNCVTFRLNSTASNSSPYLRGFRE